QGTVVLATVKGDVHDIGKNIVGVVLGCNSYEVHDLGVMVPADTVISTAAQVGADVVGLSGLITPSLDQMVDAAHEMERRGLSLPLLIGGATTSKQHTAVRIAPQYTQPVVHVLDASRVTAVVSALLDPKRRAGLAAEDRELQDRVRDQDAQRARKPLLPFAEAQELLDEIVRDGLLTARGVYGFWPASSDGDDIVVYNDNAPTRFCMLRQQSEYGDSRPNRSLADYVASSGDHLGAFAVTAGVGLEELCARFEADHDDYRSIMAKALADRLAEAFAEYLHEVARREWYETGPEAP